MKNVSAITLLVAFVACTAAAGAMEAPDLTVSTTTPTWQPVGPEGGYLKEIVVSPSDPDIVFAGSDDSGGIWKSSDGGDHWRLVTANLRNVTGWWIEFDPGNPDIMYAADIYGRHPLLKSSNAGETWNDTGNDIPFRRTSCIAIDPVDSEIIYVGTGFGDERPGDGIFKSTDGGASWAAAGQDGTTIFALEAHPSGTIFAGTADGLYRTINGGDDWTLVEGGLPATGISATLLTSNGTLYAACAGLVHSVYRSVDGGQTWNGLGLPAVLVWDIAEEPGSNGDVVYCAALGGPNAVYKTEDAGQTWTPRDAGIMGKWAISLAQSSDGTLYCSNFTNQGVYRSDDGATTWSQANTGLFASYVTGMTLDPSDSTRLLATGLGPYSADPNALGPVTWAGASSGGSVEWSLLNTLHVQTYAPSISPADPDTIIYGSFLKGVYFSDSGGAGVTNVHGAGICVATVFDPDDPNIAMASVTEVSPPSQVILRTDDHGGSWDEISVGFSASRLLAEPGSPNVWAATTSGIHVSENNGLTWAPRGLDGIELLTMAQHPSRPATLVAGGRDTAMYITSNAGASWIPIAHPAWPDGCDVRSLAFHPSDADLVYAGLNAAELHSPLEDHDGWRGGVWATSNLGGSWNEITGDLNNDHIWDLRVTPNAQWLYVATYGGGIYRTTIDSSGIFDLPSLGTPFFTPLSTSSPVPRAGVPAP